jgi:fumarate reductase subunit C
MSTAYRSPVSLLWWLQRRSYFVFVLREISSVFVAWFVVYLLLLVHAIGSGGDRYAQFLAWSGGWVLALNVVALLFVLLHTVTWFGLTPKAVVVRVRGRRVGPGPVLCLQYVLWLVMSAAVAWVVLDG